MFETAEIRRVRLADCCERITKGTTPTTIGFSYESTGVNFIKIETIDSRGELIPDKVSHISPTCHSAMGRSQLFEGDLLFSIAGAIGRCAIVPSWVLPANTNQALSIIRLKNDAPLNRFYLKEALSSSLIIEMTRRAKRGIAQVNLSLKDVGNFSIPLPPIKQQERFAEFVNQVDKLRFDDLSRLFLPHSPPNRKPELRMTGCSGKKTCDELLSQRDQFNNSADSFFSCADLEKSKPYLADTIRSSRSYS